MYPPTVFSSQAFVYPQVAIGYQPMTHNTIPITMQVSPVPYIATNIKPLGLPLDNYQQVMQVPFKRLWIHLWMLTFKMYTFLAIFALTNMHFRGFHSIQLVVRQ